MTSTVDALRGEVIESRHRVSAAVCRGDGALVVATGDPDLVTFWRSAAKFFQALPLVADGAADALGLSDEELALACASHNGEPAHVSAARRFLARSGSREEDLVCGPHPSLSEAVARAMSERGERPTRAHSNCSGKHAGMLALARWRRWDVSYAAPAHPVQRRCLAEVSAWTGVSAPAIGLATDGCGVPSFALPLKAMAAAYARVADAAAGREVALPEGRGPAMARVVGAVRRNPFMIAGTGRLDTLLLEATKGAVVSKVGAEGVYCAALPEPGLGLALKVEDGDARSVGPALLALLAILAPGLVHLDGELREPPIRNSLGSVVGRLVPRVSLDRAG
jgi:L-asparaginase II